MLSILGNDILRSGAKIGWIEGNDIRDHDGKKLGYFTDTHVYRGKDGIAVAFIKNNDFSLSNGSIIKLDELRHHVTGGNLSDIARGAIKVLMGD